MRPGPALIGGAAKSSARSSSPEEGTVVGGPRRKAGGPLHSCPSPKDCGARAGPLKKSAGWAAAAREVGGEAAAERDSARGGPSRIGLRVPGAQGGKCAELRGTPFPEAQNHLFRSGWSAAGTGRQRGPDE